MGDDWMAITETATHAPPIDGKDVTTARTRQVFGPVRAVRSFSNANQAFALGGDTRCGPAAPARTRDALRAQRAARGLEAGTVWINEHLAGGSEMPHGEVRDRGSART